MPISPSTECLLAAARHRAVTSDDSAHTAGLKHQRHWSQTTPGMVAPNSSSSQRRPSSPTLGYSNPAAMRAAMSLLHEQLIAAQQQRQSATKVVAGQPPPLVQVNANRNDSEKKQSGGMVPVQQV